MVNILIDKLMMDIIRSMNIEIENSKENMKILEIWRKTILIGYVMEFIYDENQ